MTGPAPTYLANPRKPRLTLPPGACDAHVHVFGPGSRFPYEAGRNPPDAPKEKLFALHAHLGFEHCVIVHTAQHGMDNAATADALAAKGGAYRGIGLMAPAIPDAALKRLDAAGFRGTRFQYMAHLPQTATPEEAVAYSRRIADLGWHIQIQMAAELVAELSPVLKRAATPVVIDHMGRVDAGLGLEQPAFRALLALLESPNIWVKISGCDRATRQGPPYADAVPFARKLVAEFGDRVLWGSDWPHPAPPGPIPDDGDLVDLLAEAAPGPALQAVLVDNPQRLFRFAKASS